MEGRPDLLFKSIATIAYLPPTIAQAGRFGVASLARPGGNITGVSAITSELTSSSWFRPYASILIAAIHQPKVPAAPAVPAAASGGLTI